MTDLSSRLSTGTLVDRLQEGITKFGMALGPIAARIALALPFFRSGLTRWSASLAISPGTTYLFEEQFKLHIFGRLYGLPAPDQLAYVVGSAEIILPLLLIAGLATRFAAFGLLMMTAIIQLVFPGAWANFHLYWASLALTIMALGAGPLSLDHGIGRLRQRRSRSAMR